MLYRLLLPLLCAVIRLVLFATALMTLVTSLEQGLEGDPQQWILVQSRTQSVVGHRNAVGYPAVTTAGNLLVAEVDWPSGLGFVSFIDNAGNTWKQLGPEVNCGTFGYTSRLYWTIAIGGPDSITTVVTPFWQTSNWPNGRRHSASCPSSAPSQHALRIREFSGPTNDPVLLQQELMLLSSPTAFPDTSPPAL